MDDRLRTAMHRFQSCIEQRDRPLAEATLDADYALVLVHPAKAVVPRERWLDVLADYVVHDYEVQDEIVDVSDGIAVALHRDQMSATVLGEDRSGTFIITDVWKNGPDGWRIWRRHSTPLSAGELPGA